jgi:hypothetical protein
VPIELVVALPKHLGWLIVKAEGTIARNSPLADTLKSDRNHRITFYFHLAMRPSAQFHFMPDEFHLMPDKFHFMPDKFHLMPDPTRARRG